MKRFILQENKGAGKERRAFYEGTDLQKAAADILGKDIRKTEICKEKLAVISDLLITGAAAYDYF